MIITVTFYSCYSLIWMWETASRMTEQQQQEIDECIKKTIEAHNKIQGEAQKAQKGD